MSVALTAPLNDAIKYCQAMEMKLASPQSQKEYDNLKNLLLDTKFEWQNAAIAGYMTSDGEWVDSGDKLKYEINWGEGEPNNLKSNEACIFMQTKDGISVNDDPCVGHSFPFICEYTHEELRVREDKNELKRFMRPLVVYIEEDLINHQELFVSHERLSLNWIDSQLLCQSFGLEIFTPETEEEINIVKGNLLQLHSGIKLIHIGVTKIGSDSWYSINTGENFNGTFKTESRALKSTDDDAVYDEYDYKWPSGDFLMIRINDQISKFVQASRNDHGHFICQKQVKMIENQWK